MIIFLLLQRIAYVEGLVKKEGTHARLRRMTARMKRNELHSSTRIKDVFPKQRKHVGMWKVVLGLKTRAIVENIFT